MRYTTRIKLPVERGNFESYAVSKSVLQQILDAIGIGNILSVEWENDDCVAIVGIQTSLKLETEYSSLELFVRNIINQNSGRI